MIVRWKEHADRSATTLVTAWFAQGLSACLAVATGAVVPIPSTERARRHRGREPLRACLERVHPALPLQPALVSSRERGDQAGLGRQERQHNLRDAFAWQGANDTPVWLVDDVATTGATLDSAVTELRRHGVPVHGAFVLATREAQPLDPLMPKA